MKKIKDKIHYALQSVRNRYPCKIINIKNYDTTSKESMVVFQSVKAFNISTLTLRSLMEDPLLLEKFHPSDAVKLGFFSAFEIMLPKIKDDGDLLNKYIEAAKSMLEAHEE